MTEKPNITLPGTVEKIIQPSHPDEPEKAQIAIEGAEILDNGTDRSDALRLGDERASGFGGRSSGTTGRNARLRRALESRRFARE